MLIKLNRLCRLSLAAIFVLSAFFGLTSTARAQATRTWISGVGDDANPGSRTAPCKTLAGAIAKTTAGGEIDALDPGGFGALTITKAITIDGKGSLASILASGTTGLNVAAGSNDIVTIRNFSITGQGTGIYGINILSAGQVRIENCVIFGFANDGIHFSQSASSAVLYVQNTQIHNCNNGIYVNNASSPANVVIENCQVAECATGFFGDANTTSAIRNSLFTQNTGPGINISASSAVATIDNTEVSGNGAGISAGGAITISRDTIVNNTGTGLTVTGTGSIRTFHNNVITGNNPDGTPTGSLPLK
jgi:hypothetical protein